MKRLGEILGEDTFLAMEDEEHGWTHRDEIFARTAARLLTRPSRHWLDAFAAAGIWAGPVYGYATWSRTPRSATTAPSSPTSTPPRAA